MKKRILYLAHRIPYPPNKGDKIRSFNEIKYFSQYINVDLLCLVDAAEDFKYIKKLKLLCSRVMAVPLRKYTAFLRGARSLAAGGTVSQGYFHNERLQHFFDSFISNTSYDAVICFSSPMAEYIFRSKIFKNLNERPNLIMDFCDLDSDKWIQYARKGRGLKSIIYKAEGRRLLKYEIRINRAFDRSIFVSQHEADLFTCRFPTAQNVQVVVNGVDYDYFSPVKIPVRCDLSRPRLMFPGAMDYHANSDGVKWFCREIFPLIRRSVPEVHFYITGSNPRPDVKRLGREKNVIVTGFVKDIRKHYRAADICVIPLRMARGVQNKVLEAMASGKPVIATSIAAQGIDAVPGRELICVDTPVEFARAVITLLKSFEKREGLGSRARQFIRKSHNWSENLKQLGTGVIV